jgi:hypothetical protein
MPLWCHGEQEYIVQFRFANVSFSGIHSAHFKDQSSARWEDREEFWDDHP